MRNVDINLGMGNCEVIVLTIHTLINLFKGPWCYTQSSEENVYTKSYCDLPFCDDRDGQFVSTQTDFYSHIINIEESRNYISFSVRLWQPDEEYKSVVRILLGVLNMCASREDFQKWGTALELSISNRGIHHAFLLHFIIIHYFVMILYSACCRNWYINTEYYSVSYKSSTKHSGCYRIHGFHYILEK